LLIIYWFSVVGCTLDQSNIFVGCPLPVVVDHCWFLVVGCIDDHTCWLFVVGRIDQFNVFIRFLLLVVVERCGLYQSSIKRCFWLSDVGFQSLVI
jgi:hypothetical protein